MRLCFIFMDQKLHRLLFYEGTKKFTKVSEKKTLFIRFRRRKVEKPIQIEQLIMMKIFKKHSYYKALPYMSKD